MANQDHVEILSKGKEVWNTWRNENRDIKPDLSGVNLKKIPKHWANFNFRNDGRNYSTQFFDFDFSHSILDDIFLRDQDLSCMSLEGASLRQCDLRGQYLQSLNLQGVDLSYSNMAESTIIGSDMSNARLEGTNLCNCILTNVNLSNSILNNCNVYGSSVWNVNLKGTRQENLIITDLNEPVVTVDNLKVSQFIYLLIANPEIREVIDTITSKVVLILGRFTEERKRILDSLREHLRNYNYSPILFDFEGPSNRDFTETIRLLAHMSKFVIADLSDPKSVPQELTAIIPFLPSVPILPIIQEDQKEYGMFEHFQSYHWVLQIYKYHDSDQISDEIQLLIESVEAYIGSVQK